MQILKNIDDLTTFLKAYDAQPGCLADTSFLYALSYDDDRLYDKAVEVSEILAEATTAIYANVISRMEFVDLIFRKQITLGAISVFEKMSPDTTNKSLYNLLKNIRDQDTSHKKNNRSYKVNEGRLKKLRHELNYTSSVGWKTFSGMYAGNKLFNEWQLLEEELGLNFVEIMESETSDLFNSPLLWSDMVKLMGQEGLRGPDAMILNFFSKSKLPLLITGDSDFDIAALNDLEGDTNRAIYIL